MLQHLKAFTLFFGFAWLWAVLFSGASFTEQHSLIVKFTELRNDKGVVYYALFSKADADAFPRNTKSTAASGSVTITGNEAVKVFENLPIGEYAITFFHDENSNGKFDTNFIGWPLEGYGFSNIPNHVLIPPSFEKARFVFRSHNQTQTVKMLY